MANNDESRAGFASPPCYAQEFELGEHGYMPVDDETARDVARWRKAKRAELIAARVALTEEQQQHATAAVARELDRLIEPGKITVVSVYWPFRGELDLRGWMRSAVALGARVALPVVEAKGEPLLFRAWTPGARLRPGVWKIPVPAEGEVVTPRVVIAPLVGYDPGCFRLGYGGGFFDRTLAALSPRPRVIGVGHDLGALTTIFPQPHDIPMDVIVTGSGVVATCKSS